MTTEKDKQRMAIADQITAFFAEGREVELVERGKSGQVKEMLQHKKGRYVKADESKTELDTEWRKPIRRDR